MNKDIRDLIESRPRGPGIPDRAAIERWLGVQLVLERDAGAYMYYRAPLHRGPLASADVRLLTNRSKAIVVLDAAPDTQVTEPDLGLMAAYGEPRNIDIAPPIPPEGAIAYVYRLGSENVSFSFTYKTRRLRHISFVWGE